MKVKPRIKKIYGVWICSYETHDGVSLATAGDTPMAAFRAAKKDLIDRSALERDANRFWRKNVLPGTTLANFEGARRVETIEIIVCVILAIIAGFYLGRAVAGLIHSCGV